MGIKKLFNSEEVNMSNIIKILNKDGQLVVSSRQVARDFEKEHKHVLESIDALVKDVKIF